ncbi:hypothetical protein BGX27_011518 [Mortierella sp. AM989]|nr:hypothetical protein BGX27_011518 [Mortierella sp. AM989]
MGSSLSKSKKKSRQSAAGKKKKRTDATDTIPQPSSDNSLPQNPRHWSSQTQQQQQQLQHRSQQQQQQVADYNPQSQDQDYDSSIDQSKVEGAKKSARNSGGNTQHGNISQPRTSSSHGRSSFSVLRGRKSGQHQREGEGSQPIMHISSPIVNPINTTDYVNGLLSNEQVQPLRQHGQRLPENNIEQQRITSGAYKAPVPSLPYNIQPSSLPPPPQMATPPLPGSESPSFSSPPGSNPTTLQGPQRLWRESLRNAAAAEGRNSDSRSSMSSSVYTSSTGMSYKKNKPISGSTFATTLSLSPSNASQASIGAYRQHSNKSSTVHPENTQEPRLSHQHYQPQQDYQESADDASTVTLPGSRYMGRDGSIISAEDDSTLNHSSMPSKSASEVALMGSVLNVAATASGSPSLMGVNTQNERYDNQFPSSRQSGPITQPQKSQQKGLFHMDSPSITGEYESRGTNKTLTTSSTRESVSSINTANYQWMDEQTNSSDIRDVINRESVMMLFHSPTAPEFGSSPKNSSAGALDGITPEQQSQQIQEHQAQQHALLKCFFKGNYHAPLSQQELGSILDVGCGTGLWMKDMALEFPLTEIHGVDINVPSRRRRSKATPSTPTSPIEHHSSPLTDGSLNAPGAVSGAPDSLESMPSNCFFHKADIAMGLPFADSTFDYCHVRLVLWGYRLNCFPDLLNELIRVTKKSGWIEFVDMDPCILKATDAGECINEWIKTGLIHSNMDPDLVKTLPKFLKEFCDATIDAAKSDSSLSGQAINSTTLIQPTQAYGLENLQVSKTSLPFGSWGGQIGELWQQTYISFLKGLEPMMVDATLSGLVMDQYHRQCQLEMQQIVEANANNTSNRLSGGNDQLMERITSFDQRLCTHKAWYHLIQRLLNDATVSYPNMPSSSPSSIKEMRSYNNLYVAYAQKVDIIDLKQQLLLRQLEQEILSPNPSMASSSTFSTVAAGTFGSVNSRQPYNQKSVQKQEQPQSEIYENLDQNKRLASTLRGKISSSNLHQCYVSTSSSNDEANFRAVEYKKEGEDGRNNLSKSRSRNRYGFVAPLTRDALESFNKTNSDQEEEVHIMSTSSALPTPASVAALSIRSNSRNSNRNDTICSPGGVAAMLPSVRTPSSVTNASGFHSPRVAVNGPRRFDTTQNGLSSPQPEVQTEQADSQDEDIRNSFEADYFNQGLMYRPSAYHQQQYKHHQQQMNTLKKNPSLLSKVLVNVAAVGVAADSAGHARQTNEETNVPEYQQKLVDTHVDAAVSFSNPTLEANAAETFDERYESKAEDPQRAPEVKNDDVESDILIAVDEDDGDEFEDEDEFGVPRSSQSLEATIGMVPEHSASVRKGLVPIKSSRAIIEASHNSHDMIEHSGYTPTELDKQVVGGEETIDIINQVSHGNTGYGSHDSISDESQFQMLPVGEEEEEEEEEDEIVEEEEVFVMMAPVEHRYTTVESEHLAFGSSATEESNQFAPKQLGEFEDGQGSEQEHDHDQQHQYARGARG